MFIKARKGFYHVMLFRFSYLNCLIYFSRRELDDCQMHAQTVQVNIEVLKAVLNLGERPAVL